MPEADPCSTRTWTEGLPGGAPRTPGHSLRRAVPRPAAPRSLTCRPDLSLRAGPSPSRPPPGPGSATRSAVQVMGSRPRSPSLPRGCCRKPRRPRPRCREMLTTHH